VHACSRVDFLETFPEKFRTICHRFKIFWISGRMESALGEVLGLQLIINIYFTENWQMAQNWFNWQPNT